MTDSHEIYIWDEEYIYADTEIEDEKWRYLVASGLFYPTKKTKNDDQPDDTNPPHHMPMVQMLRK